MSQAPSQFPAPHVVPPLAATHTSTIILLHGRGSSGPEFADDLFECQVPTPPPPPTPSSAPSTKTSTLPDRYPNCKWIFPSTKSRYSTTFQEEMPEWFDTVSLRDPTQREELQVEGLSEAVVAIAAVIEREARLVGGPGRIILGGISQGYATASQVLMALDVRLAGFVGLSGWMPFSRQIGDAGRDGQGGGAMTRFVRGNLGLGEGIGGLEMRGERGWSGTEMFLGHELRDEVVCCELGRVARDTFCAVGAVPLWYTYDSGDHWVKEPEEVEDLVGFLDHCLA